MPKFSSRKNTFSPSERIHEHFLLGMVAIVHYVEIERNTFRKQIVIQTKNVFLGFVQNDAINIRFID